MSDFKNEKFPVGALYGAAGLIGFALIMVFGVRGGVLPARETAPQARERAQVAVIASRDFRFSDRADGALVATDTSDNSVAMIMEPGSNSGFIRGVMRGLMRERMLKESQRDAPVTVTQWANGALTLKDTATGRIIELGSFGSDNRKSFAKLLEARDTLIVKTDPNGPGGFFGAGPA